MSGGEVFIQFVQARTAYRNGLKILSPSVGRQCLVGPIATEPSCFFWTGDCSTCPADPGAPGLVSCWCKKTDVSWSVSEPVALVSAGTTAPIDIGLVTNTTPAPGVQTINQRFFADPSLNTPVGSHQL